MFKYVVIFLCFTVLFTYSLSNNVCELPVDNGRCNMEPDLRWYFDAKLKTCKQFIFTCGGNGNNFRSYDECIGVCTNICTLPGKLDTGFPFVKRYYFNPKKNICAECVITERKGNNNIFLSLDKCQSTCMSVCTLPPETGLCRAMFKRFYFNYKSQECETFIYGGCGGNGNNFEDIKDCKHACQYFKVLDVPDYFDKFLGKFGNRKIE